MCRLEGVIVRHLGTNKTSKLSDPVKRRETNDLPSEIRHKITLVGRLVLCIGHVAKFGEAANARRLPGSTDIWVRHFFPSSFHSHQAVFAISAVGFPLAETQTTAGHILFYILYAHSLFRLLTGHNTLSLEHLVGCVQHQSSTA